MLGTLTAFLPVGKAITASKARKQRAVASRAPHCLSRLRFPLHTNPIGPHQIAHPPDTFIMYKYSSTSPLQKWHIYLPLAHAPDSSYRFEVSISREVCVKAPRPLFCSGSKTRGGCGYHDDAFEHSGTLCRV